MSDCTTCTTCGGSDCICALTRRLADTMTRCALYESEQRALALLRDDPSDPRAEAAQFRALTAAALAFEDSQLASGNALAVQRVEGMRQAIRAALADAMRSYYETKRGSQ